MNIAEQLSLQDSICLNEGVLPIPPHHNPSGISSAMMDFYSNKLEFDMVLILVCVLVVCYLYIRFISSYRKRRYIWTALFHDCIHCRRSNSNSIGSSNSSINADILDGLYSPLIIPSESIEKDINYNPHAHEDWLDIIYNKYDFKEALLFHSRIPYIIRYMVPVLCIVALVLFTDSNASADIASIYVRIYTPEETVSPPALFSFGLAGMVEAG